MPDKRPKAEQTQMDLPAVKDSSPEYNVFRPEQKPDKQQESNRHKRHRKALGFSDCVDCFGCLRCFDFSVVISAKMICIKAICNTFTIGILLAEHNAGFAPIAFVVVGSPDFAVA